MVAKWGKTDFKELYKMRDNVKEAAETTGFIENVAKELTARLLGKVIPRTPVGKYPTGSGKMGGTLRRGWTSPSNKDAELNTIFGGKSNVTEYVANIPITKIGSIYEIEIINPIEYASFVEYGHRTKGGHGWVKGRYMLTISAKEIERDAPKIIAKKLEEYLRGVFK